MTIGTSSEDALHEDSKENDDLDKPDRVSTFDPSQDVHDRMLQGPKGWQSRATASDALGLLPLRYQAYPNINDPSHSANSTHCIQQSGQDANNESLKPIKLKRIRGKQRPEALTYTET